MVQGQHIWRKEARTSEDRRPREGEGVREDRVGNSFNKRRKGHEKEERFCEVGERWKRRKEEISNNEGGENTAMEYIGLHTV